MSKGKNIFIRREVLLVEIERRCAVDAECSARTRIGLTKEEARGYCGFTCERCERWNVDILTERDVPDWWEELIITGLSTLRAVVALTTPASAADEPGEVIKRLSDNYKAEVKRRLPRVNEDED